MENNFEDLDGGKMSMKFAHTWFPNAPIRVGEETVPCWPQQRHLTLECDVNHSKTKREEKNNTRHPTTTPNWCETENWDNYKSVLLNILWFLVISKANIHDWRPAVSVRNGIRWPSKLDVTQWQLSLFTARRVDSIKMYIYLGELNS